MSPPVVDSKAKFAIENDEPVSPLSMACMFRIKNEARLSVENVLQASKINKKGRPLERPFIG